MKAEIENKTAVTSLTVQIETTLIKKVKAKVKELKTRNKKINLRKIVEAAFRDFVASEK